MFAKKPGAFFLMGYGLLKKCSLGKRLVNVGPIELNKNVLLNLAKNFTTRSRTCDFCAFMTRSILFSLWKHTGGNSGYLHCIILHYWENCVYFSPQINAGLKAYLFQTAEC